MIKYLFADRDGTLILDKHYLSDPAQVELFPGVSNSLKLLQDNAIKIFVVTNQSGIGRGYFSENDFFACQEALKFHLQKKGEPTGFSSEVFGIKQEKTKCYLVSTLSSLSDFIIKDSRD